MSLDGEDESSEVHLGRMLQILREFPDDPLLSAYVIDDVWDDMKAMKVTFFYLIAHIVPLQNGEDLLRNLQGFESFWHPFSHALYT